MTELTPARPQQRKYFSFGLVAGVTLIVFVMSFVQHRPVRLPTACIFASLVCSSAYPVGPPALRKPLIGVSLALLAVALYLMLTN